VSFPVTASDKQLIATGPPHCIRLEHGRKRAIRAFFAACGKAQAAADYLRGLALRDQQPTMAA
jgi:hypothetical protein